MNERNDDYSFRLTKDVLAIQLLEIAVALIHQIRNYAKQNAIVLIENPSVDILLAKAKNLINEMETIESSATWSADEFLQRKRTDKDLTEPIWILIVSYMEEDLDTRRADTHALFPYNLPNAQENQNSAAKNEQIQLFASELHRE